MTDIVDVVAALIWKREYGEERFLICQRAPQKSRGLLWEFVGGKAENGESLETALKRECNEELGIEIKVGELFMSVVHEYADITIRLSVFNAEILFGVPKMLEHNALHWIKREEIPHYDFCPADVDVLAKLVR